MNDEIDESQAEFDRTYEESLKIENDSQRWRVLALWHLFNGDKDIAVDYYEKMIAEDSRSIKMFSPCFYLIQLERLFPERPEFTELLNHIKSQIT